MKMNAHVVLRRTMPTLALLAATVFPCRASSAAVPRASAATEPVPTVFVTNRVTRVLTNVIEVTMPVNQFAYEFRTNYIDKIHTNVVNVYRTNWLERTLTNATTVDLTQTNRVTAYRTNLNTLTATNWKTVVVLKTNWVTQTVTNTLQIDLPATAGTAPAAQPRPTAPSQEDPQVIASLHGLQIRLNRTTKTPGNGEVEVELSVTAANAASLRVREWQLIRPDGTVLFFGQRPRFTAELEPGTYQVVVSVRLAEKTAPFTVSGTMTIGSDGSIARPLASVSTSAP